MQKLSNGNQIYQNKSCHVLIQISQIYTVFESKIIMKGKLRTVYLNDKLYQYKLTGADISKPIKFKMTINRFLNQKTAVWEKCTRKYKLLSGSQARVEFKRAVQFHKTLFITFSQYPDDKKRTIWNSVKYECNYFKFDC